MNVVHYSIDAREQGQVMRGLSCNILKQTAWLFDRIVVNNRDMMDLV